MARRHFLKQRPLVLGILGAFALIGVVRAAEPGPQGDNRAAEAAQTAAPRETGSAELFSRLRFFGEFGPIFLHRQDNRSAVLLRDSTTGATLLNATSLDLGWQNGLEARGGLGLGDFGIEFRWFNVGGVFRQWSEGTSLTTPVVWDIPTRPPLVGLGAANISASLDSKLANIEGNLSWQVHPYVAALAGVRYISVEDNLGLRADFGGNIANVGFASRNSLWGGQLGLEGRMPVLTKDLLLGGAVKGAYLHNSTRIRFALAQQFGSDFAAGDRDGQNTWAFELAADARYNVFSRVTVLAGYQALWIRRIAHATDQINRIDVATASGDVRSRSVWFHGPRLAVVIRLPE